MHHYLFIISLLLACSSNNGNREIYSSTQQNRPDTTHVDTLKGTNIQEKRLRFHSSLKDRYNTIFKTLNDSLFDGPAIYKEKLFEGKRFFYSQKDSTLIEIDVTYPKITVNRSFYLQDPKKYNFKLLLKPFQMGFLQDGNVHFIELGLVKLEGFHKSDLRITNHVAKEEDIRYVEVDNATYELLENENETLRIGSGNTYMGPDIGKKLTSFFDEHANRYLNDYADLDNVQIRFDLVFELDGRLNLSEISLMHYNNGKYELSPLRRDCKEHLVDFLTKQSKWENKLKRRTFHSINYNVGLKI